MQKLRLLRQRERRQQRYDNGTALNAPLAAEGFLEPRRKTAKRFRVSIGTMLPVVWGTTGGGTMHRGTDNGIADVLLIVASLTLSCGFGWWMRNRTLQAKLNRLKNVELLCNRLWHQLQEQDAQLRQRDAQLRQRDGQIRQLDEQLRQCTDRQRRLMPPPRKPT